MKTLLIPVDFTPTSDNAVNFAIEWCKRYDYKKVILLKTFYDSMFENIIVAAEYSGIHQDNLNLQRVEATEQLQQLCNSVAERLEGVKVITAVSELPLLRSIFEIIQTEETELIILGSDNNNYSSGSIVSSNVISIAKASPVRVLVVPADYHYQPVTQALLPYNLNMLNDLERLSSLRTSPKWHEIKLLVLNIDTNQDLTRRSEKFDEAQDKFQNLLKNFDLEIHNTSDTNLINEIDAFMKEHAVQLMIALPGKHSFLYRLTHQSISEAIYSHARVPVLILK